jgi:hypothetical protein
MSVRRRFLCFPEENPLMSKHSPYRIPARTTLALLLLLTIPLSAAAQSEKDSGPLGTGSADRLFLGFAEDPVLADDQWWEVQGSIIDQNPVDVTLARFVVALQPYDNFEFGGSIGFGSSDTPAPFPEGSGATDLELWGKYHLGSSGDDTQFAVGGLAVVPTGDDTAGLGFDSFSAGVFGSMRHRLSEAVLSGHIGARYNQDGRFLGADLDGKSSVLLGAGVIVPVSDEFSVVGEAKVESRRFEGGDSDFRLLGGFNWHMNNRGVMRAAAAFGLTDGAPDLQVLVGYALIF